MSVAGPDRPPTFKTNDIVVIVVLLTFQKFYACCKKKRFVLQFHASLLFVETHFVEEKDQGVFFYVVL